jgi:hypothetical protein
MHPRFGEIDLSNYKVAIGGGAAVIEATSNRCHALTGGHIEEGYTNEAEAILTACDGISECNCIGVPDAKSGVASRIYGNGRDRRRHASNTRQAGSG